MLGEVKFGKGAVQPGGPGRCEAAQCWVRERAGNGFGRARRKSIRVMRGS